MTVAKRVPHPKTRRNPYDLSFSMLRQYFYGNSFHALNWVWPLDTSQFLERVERHEAPKGTVWEREADSTEGNLMSCPPNSLKASPRLALSN